MLRTKSNNHVRLSATRHCCTVLPRVHHRLLIASLKLCRSSSNDSDPSTSGTRQLQANRRPSRPRVSTPCNALTFPPSTDRARTLDDELPAILDFLGHGKQPNEHTSEELDHLHRRARNFFTHDNRLWRCDNQGRHQLVLQDLQQRLSVTRDAHNRLGHKGFYSTLRALLDRFWWPSLAHDVRWYVKTCHECQIRQTTKVRIPPTVAAPAPLFHIGPMSIQCSCHTHLATNTSFKPVAPSLHGPSGVLSVQKLDAPSVPSSLRKSCAGGEPSPKS
jgi:hypothetical protein